MNDKIKYLISSPSNISGEYHSNNLDIVHAYPLYNRNLNKNGSIEEQYFYVIETEYKIHNDNTNNEIDYNYICIDICTILSIFFGKVFYYHGIIEISNGYTIPSLRFYKHFYKNAYPFNSEVRPDSNYLLKLEELDIIYSIFNYILTPNKKKIFKEFMVADKQYLFSLQNAHENPDIAYVDLVESGEIFSNSIKLSDSEIYDEAVLKVLSDIEKLENGINLIKVIKSRMQQITKRYVNAIIKYLDDYFFSISYSNSKTYRLNKDNINKILKNSYNLRSIYFHRGERIGVGVMMSMYNGYEYNNSWNGKPSRDLVNSMIDAASYVGLERIIRYCLYKRMFEIIS
jgi:hypothetical protein